MNAVKDHIVNVLNKHIKENPDHNMRQFYVYENYTAFFAQINKAKTVGGLVTEPLIHIVIAFEHFVLGQVYLLEHFIKFNMKPDFFKKIENKEEF